MRQRLIRDHPRPPADAILVRALFDGIPGGDAFDRDVLIADVSYNFEVFGYYGLSLWLVSDLWPRERLLSEKTRKARRVAQFSAGELLGQGLGLVPSGKVPHYDATLGLVYGVSYGGDQNPLEALSNSSTGSSAPPTLWRTTRITSRTRAERGSVVIQIDIDADLNIVDDDDRNLAPLPRNAARLKVGGVAVAGRPGFWSWVVVEELTDTSVFFRQVSAREAAAHGDLAVPASA